MARIKNLEAIVGCIRLANLQASEKEVVYVTDLVVMANAINAQNKKIKDLEAQLKRSNQRLESKSVEFLTLLDSKVEYSELGSRLDCLS